jgi:hypothetical protein
LTIVKVINQVLRVNFNYFYTGFNPMSYAFVPGTSDLTSVSVAAALLESAFLLQAAENAVPSATRPNIINVTIDTDSSTANISAQIPLTFTTGVNGFALAAADYPASPVVAEAFVGTGSDIATADTKQGAFLQLAGLLNDKERTLTTPLTNVTLSANLDTMVASVNASIPITVVVNGTGQAVITGVDYIP